LADLKANFGDSTSQGTTAYVSQITLDHPDKVPGTRTQNLTKQPLICHDGRLRRQTLPELPTPSPVIVPRIVKSKEQPIH
jgi:hypothetical protein